MRDQIGTGAAGVRKAIRWFALAGLLLAGHTACSAVETVTVVVPAGVAFAVTDVTTATNGTPNPFTVSYSASALTPGNQLYIRVQANAANFTTPGGGGTIPCGNVSWTISSDLNGAGVPGTLATSYTLVYTSMVNPTNGNVKVKWHLAAPPAGIYAGAHTLVMTWKFESL